MNEKDLIKALKKPFTKKEKEVIALHSFYLLNISSVYRAIIDIGEQSELTKISYRPKNKEREYGYYVSDHIPIIGIWLNRLKKYNFLDLGSGPGLIRNTLNHITNSRLVFKGYENEDILVTLGLRLHNNIISKNIVSLEKKDIENAEIIYFWEPLVDAVMVDKFVTNLSKITKPGQIIIYHPAGLIGGYIEKCDKFKLVHVYFPYSVYLVV